MNEWLKNLVGYMLMVSIGLQMLPNQKYEQYVKLFTGFLLVIMVLQPVLKIKSADTYLEGQMETFISQQERLEEQIAEQSLLFSEQKVESIEQIQKIEQILVEVNLDD